MEPTIRPYRPGDDEALMDVCLRTGAAGADATALFPVAPALVSELFLLPYLALEPELASVVTVGDGPAVGYVVGALDTATFEARADAVWWPALRAKYPVGTFPERSVEATFAAMLFDRRSPPAELLAEFPSHLHIDLLPAVQGRGLGRRLLERLFDQLVAAGSPGAHLGVSTANRSGVAFYLATGFEQWAADDDTVTFVRHLP